MSRLADRLRFARLTARSLMWTAGGALDRNVVGRARELAERPPARIGVFHQGGIGSGLMLGPLCQVLRSVWPDATVDLISQQRTDGELLHSVHLIDGVHVVSTERPIDGMPYDLLLSAARTLDGDRLVRRIPAALKIGFLHQVGWHAAGALFHDVAVPPDPRRHECEQNVGLLAPVFGDAVPAPPRSLLGIRRARSVTSERPRVFVHPGSSRGMAWKRWGPDGFAAVIERLHRQLGAEPTIVVGPDEIEAAAAIAARLPPGVVSQRAPGGTLIGLFHDLQQVELAISNDGLFMHAACAAGTPAVAIFGATDPAACGPWADPSSFRIVRAGLSCSPCYVPYSGVLRCTNPVHLQCMSDILPEHVCSAASELIAAVA